MTGPYLAFASSSALTASGHTRRSARHATKKRDSEDARRRDCVLVGLRENRDMAVRGVGRREKKREERDESGGLCDEVCGGLKQGRDEFIFRRARSLHLSPRQSDPGIFRPKRQENQVQSGSPDVLPVSATSARLVQATTVPDFDVFLPKPTT